MSRTQGFDKKKEKKDDSRSFDKLILQRDSIELLGSVPKWLHRERWMDGCVEITHCVLHDIVPFGAAALHGITEKNKCATVQGYAFGRICLWQGIAVQG